MPAKQRASKLDQYAEQLTGWFEADKLTLQQAQEKLAAAGCAVSVSRLGAWWGRQQEQRLQDQILQRIASGSDTCTQIEREFTRHPAPEMETLLKVLRVMIMNLSLHGQAQPELLQLAGNLLKPVMEHLKIQERGKDRELEERRVKLLENKAAQADQAREVTESNLTPEQKMEQYRAIFGMS